MSDSWEVEHALDPLSSRDRLDDPDRSILDSINHDLTGHASVGRDLSSTLDELEEALHTAG